MNQDFRMGYPAALHFIDAPTEYVSRGRTVAPATRPARITREEEVERLLLDAPPKVVAKEEVWRYFEREGVVLAPLYRANAFGSEYWEAPDWLHDHDSVNYYAVHHIALYTELTEAKARERLPGAFDGEKPAARYFRAVRTLDHGFGVGTVTRVTEAASEFLGANGKWIIAEGYAQGREQWGGASAHWAEITVAEVAALRISL